MEERKVYKSSQKQKGMRKRRLPHMLYHYPPKSGMYSFVQLSLDYERHGFREYPIWVFQKQQETHGEIIMNFLQHQKIHYPILRHEKRGVKVIEIPNLVGRNFCVLGLGKSYFDREKLTLDKIMKADEDNDYGPAGIEIGVNRAHLEQVTKHSKIKVTYPEFL